MTDVALFSPSSREPVPAYGLPDPFLDEAEVNKSARMGWIALILFFVVFLGFAAFVRLDAAVSAEGVVKVSGERQTIQHRTGGTVAALHVHEGQMVKAGDVLIDLQGAEVQANERSLAAQVIDLSAARARLQAQLAGATSFAAPAEFANMPPEYKPDMDLAMRQQQRMLATSRNAIATQKQVISQQAAQLAEKASGLGQQMDSNRQQDGSYAAQLDGMRDLASQGYASVNRVRELERARQSTEGDFARLAADRASTRNQIGEMRFRALSVETDANRQASDDLRKTIDELNSVYPRWQDAHTQVEAMKIRAPATGQVVALTVFTLGGVITPGQKLMDIVPSGAALVVEAHVSPNDAADLQVAQTAELKFPSFHERNMPPLDGKISRVSADAFTDDKSGTRYYTAEVTVTADDLAKIRSIKSTGTGLKPGLPVSVLVPLRKRTMLDYLLEPLDQAIWRSGREH